MKIIALTALLVTINTLWAQSDTLNQIAVKKPTPENALVLTPKNMLTAFNLQLGTNFDFVGEFGVADIYFNAGSFIPALFEWKGREFGLEMGVRRSRTESYNNFSAFNNTYFADPSTAANDSLTLNEYIIFSESNLKLVNTNFYLSPFVKILDRQNAVNSVQIFLHLNMELLKQELFWTYDLDSMDVRTSRIPAGEAWRYPPYYLLNSRKSDQNVYLLGLGLPVYVEGDFMAFYGKIGAGYSRIIDLGDFDFKQPYISLEMDFFERRLGIGLRAEYRHFGAERAPYLGFGISKLIDFQKLTELIAK